MITLNQYKHKAFRTLAVLSSKNEDNAHMVLGMITEVGEIGDIFKRKLAYKNEIDKINLKEEVGDLCWYIANFCNINTEIKFEFSESELKDEENFFENETSLTRSISSVIILSEIIQDCTGFMMFGNSYFIGDDCEKLVKGMMLFLRHLCELNEIDILECMQLNIEKLEKRFPDKFSEENALNRNLEEERKILEK